MSDLRKQVQTLGILQLRWPCDVCLRPIHLALLVAQLVGAIVEPHEWMSLLSRMARHKCGCVGFARRHYDRADATVYAMAINREIARRKEEDDAN